MLPERRKLEDTMDEREYKLSIRVTPEIHARFKALADRLGLTMSGFGSLCIQTGMAQIGQLVAPGDAISDKQLEKITQLMVKQMSDIDRRIDDYEAESGKGAGGGGNG
jgi:predicted DNA-binding protein